MLRTSISPEPLIAGQNAGFFTGIKLSTDDLAYDENFDATKFHLRVHNRSFSRNSLAVIFRVMEV